MTNKNKGKKLADDNMKKLESLHKKMATQYKNNDSLTIKNLAKEYNTSLRCFQKYMKNNNLVDSKRVVKTRNMRLQNQFSEIDDQLQNFKWVNEMINNGWIGEDFAEYLNCSKNYICAKLREFGNPLPSNSGQSSHEKKICDILNNNSIYYVENSRQIISPKEIDLFIPDFNLGIEINGLYWHCDDLKDKHYHLNKSNSCKERGIDLIHFYDSEIDNKFEIVQSIIKNKLNIFDNIVYARKCSIIELDNKSYKNFCNENHLQGHVPSSIRYGLLYNNELVSVIGFSKSRYNKKYQYELTRFCSKLNTKVIGGASKLFKYYLKTKNPESTISYCNKRLYDGKMYENIGMKFTHETPPNYFWINIKNEQYSRYQTQKHLLNTDLTEDEYMKQNKFYKIYDCGQRVFDLIG